MLSSSPAGTHGTRSPRERPFEGRSVKTLLTIYTYVRGLFCDTTVTQITNIILKEDDRLGQLGHLGLLRAMGSEIPDHVYAANLRGLTDRPARET